MKMKKILILTIALFATPVIIAQTVTYTGAPDAIQDNDVSNPLCTSVMMPGSATVSGTNFVRVEFSVTHPWVGDLDITLQSPDATQIFLRDRATIIPVGFVGDSSNLDEGTTLSFSDTAGSAVADMGVSCDTDDVIGTAICTEGTDFVPSQPLSTFNGENAGGVWTLCIGDGGSGDMGILASWSMVGDGTLPVELQSFSID